MRFLLLLLPLHCFAVDTEEIKCLAQNIYFESRSESTAGQIAVALVVMNRVKSTKFPNTVCEAVKEGEVRTTWRGHRVPKRDRCHFSWYCDGLSDTPTDEEAWIKSIVLANDIILGRYPDITMGSLWYHAVYIKPPWWALTLEPVVRIDNHIFYREF